MGAKVSPTVASHARHFPSLQGINVMPSGRLQSDFNNRGVSLLAGKLERDRAVNKIVDLVSSTSLSLSSTILERHLHPIHGAWCYWIYDLMAQRFACRAEDREVPGSSPTQD